MPRPIVYSERYSRLEKREKEEPRQIKAYTEVADGVISLRVYDVDTDSSNTIAVIQKGVLYTVKSVDSFFGFTLDKENADASTDDGDTVNLGKDTDEGTRNARIKAEIDKMINDPQPSDFTARGMPNLAVLSERCEFPVPKVVMEPVWELVQKERDAKEG